MLHCNMDGIGTIRELGEEDRSLLFDHISKLTDDDRCCRFMMLTGPEQIRSYVESLDFQKTIILGYRKSEGLIGVAELHLDPLHADHGEFAIPARTECTQRQRGQYRVTRYNG